jgi:nitrite reductase/ring-hydroxylating ferredoxin subunit
MNSRAKPAAGASRQGAGFTGLDDAAQLRHEREAIWRRQWLLVGHVSEFSQTGAFRTVDVAGEGAVVVNGGDGLRALTNSCLHRGYPFCADAAGVAERFTCPFHGWSYDLTGRLLDADAAASRQRLASLPLDVWNGWVFACLARRAPAPLGQQLASHLGGGPEQLSLLHSAVHETELRWSELIGLPWAPAEAPEDGDHGVFTLSDADEDTVVIEPAVSALRFRKGLVTTHTLRPAGPRSSRWTISWYLRPGEQRLTVDELQSLIGRDRRELRSHLAAPAALGSAESAPTRCSCMLDAV